MASHMIIRSCINQWINGIGENSKSACDHNIWGFNCIRTSQIVESGLTTSTNINSFTQHTVCMSVPKNFPKTDPLNLQRMVQTCGPYVEYAGHILVRILTPDSLYFYLRYHIRSTCPTCSPYVAIVLSTFEICNFSSIFGFNRWCNMWLVCPACRLYVAFTFQVQRLEFFFNFQWFLGPNIWCNMQTVCSTCGPYPWPYVGSIFSI